jgi:nucleoside-triphosphatase
MDKKSSSLSKTMNILLTGQRNIGKTTLIEAFLNANPYIIAGFVTKKQRYAQASDGVFIYDINDKNQQTSLRHLVAICGKKQIVKKFDHPFETIGVQSLNRRPCDLIIMDELGVIENQAVLFRKAIIDALNSDVPVLGVIKDSDDAYLNDIRNREDVKVISVTQKNRQETLKQLQFLLNLK